METLLDALSLVVVLLSIGCGIYWCVVAGHVLRTRLSLPTLRDGLGLPVHRSSVCVVVPAHNEASSIGAVIDSLRAQDHEAMRVVFALDRCTDATPEIVRSMTQGDERFEVVEIEHCPEGWAGKVHAVWSAVQQASHARDADHLLFIDADTSLHPGCVRSAVALLEDRGDDLLSVLSTLDVRSWYEAIVQAAAGFELTRWYPPIRASRVDRRRPFANGQFLLFRRSAYEKVGGHEATRDHLLEDLEFARRIHAFGLRASVLLAAGMHRCRMYDDWPAFVRGWKRIYIECSNRKVSRLRGAALRLWLTATLLPAASLAALLVSPAFGAIGLGGYAVGMAAIAWGGGVPFWAVAGFPVGALLTGGILWQSAADLSRGIPTQWAGRSYVREAR